MWQEEVFEKIFRAMKNDSILLTYSTKGMVRRNMRNAGFMVEKLPGPPGKREITRAFKI
ncbi:MAG: bifunctional tRNA (mnm(5)s(2)U34)-methyltransferase/FAD-dependent cmnm(5)s(2)U34 oxidoreductase [Bacteroidetes bacterium ADurb.Bin408]|nr:MAG: bifunctional tRNA (mnm(5)s(2)U34)-methyltransferase/FAD-dependent cmnm(5)s(2)U34 oxidoreductase [Bacteroidetes bacterium ADurb.Bin408]